MQANESIRRNSMSRGSAVAATAAGLVLLASAPSPAAAGATLAAPTAAPDPLAPLLAVVSLAAWLLLSWLLVVAAAASLAQLPGATGRAASAVTRRLAPVAVRRLVEVSLGLSVATGVLAASPASAGTDLPPAPPAAATASLDWPTPPAANAAPALDWDPAPAAAPVVDAMPAPARAAAPVARTVVAGPVVVRPGDSLWAVAADHLPADATDAQVAQAWPSWWAANRAAVGSDPDLIHPGLHLTPPTQR